MALEFGKVVLFKDDVGYGFLEPSSGDVGDLYFHASSLTTGTPGKKSIATGTRVEFERALRHGRPIARNVTPIELGNDEVEVGHDSSSTQ